MGHIPSCFIFLEENGCNWCYFSKCLVEFVIEAIGAWRFFRRGNYRLNFLNGYGTVTLCFTANVYFGLHPGSWRSQLTKPLESLREKGTSFVTTVGLPSSVPEVPSEPRGGSGCPVPHKQPLYTTTGFVSMRRLLEEP